ncbi:MAG: class I SAM-dependent methyltransferase [Thermoanaerobaculia bacterium]
MNPQLATDAAAAWPLEVFERSLKKRQKLELLLTMVGPLEDELCLLLTCGDNTGALNVHFREAGGRWSWAEMEADRIASIASLLGDPVHHASADELPFPDARFDHVVVIDVHEHLRDVRPLNREIARVLAPGGRAVLTTPNGNPRLPLAVAKRVLGMSPEVYGHHVQGYTAEALEAMARAVGLVPEARGAYSRFFTEAIELAINFAYVKMLPRAVAEKPREGEIAPSTSADLERVGGAYRLYARLFPLLRAISKLDRIVPGRGGYAVAIAARRPR